MPVHEAPPALDAKPTALAGRPGHYPQKTCRRTIIRSPQHAIFRFQTKLFNFKTESNRLESIISTLII